MKNEKTKITNKQSSTNGEDTRDLSQKLQELEMQKEKLEETVKAREEQLLNLFSYIQTSAK